MQYSRIMAAFGGIFFLFASPVLAAPTVTIAADNWCPINCARPERELGVGIDLAKAIFEPLGYEVRYHLMSWTDALAQAREGTVDAVIGASKFDDPSLIFPQQSVYNMSDDFYVLKGNSWRFQGVHTLKNKKIGVIADYGYGQVISDYIRNNQANLDLIQFVTGDNALPENIKKLQRHELDAIVETKPVMEFRIAKMHLEDQIEWAGSSPQARVFLAFSPALPNSKTLAAQFDAGIRRLQAEGKLEGFYANYGLTSADR